MTKPPLALLGGQPVRSRPFASWPVFGAAEEDRLLRVLRSGQWGRLDGTEVAEFEERFAAMHGCRHGIAVVNGTVALKIALLAGGIRANDEVIVPPYTFVATATAVLEANAIPVFADVDLATFNLDPPAVAAAITPRTKAIIPVHFAGQPADMDALMALARPRGILVLEDAAHAHGAKYRGRPAGSLADLATFSFQSSKNVTAGEGGIITTNDDALAAVVPVDPQLRPGAGRHLVRAPRRLGQLPPRRVSGRSAQRPARSPGGAGRRLASATAAGSSSGSRASRACIRSGVPPNARGTPTTSFMVRIDPAVFGASRNSVLKALEAEGIPCSAGYGYSLPDQPLFRNKAFGPFVPDARDRLDYSATRCPNSDTLCREQALWLGQNLLLGSEDGRGRHRDGRREGSCPPARARMKPSLACRPHGAWRERVPVGDPCRHGRDRSADDRRRDLPDRGASALRGVERARRALRPAPAGARDGDVRRARGVRVPRDRVRSRPPLRAWRRSSAARWPRPSSCCCRSIRRRQRSGWRASARTACSRRS